LERHSVAGDASAPFAWSSQHVSKKEKVGAAGDGSCGGAGGGAEGTGGEGGGEGEGEAGGGSLGAAGGDEGGGASASKYPQLPDPPKAEQWLQTAQFGASAEKLDKAYVHEPKVGSPVSLGLQHRAAYPLREHTFAVLVGSTKYWTSSDFHVDAW
jgi:hypothetical protein